MRGFTERDLDELAEITADPEVNRYLGVVYGVHRSTWHLPRA